MTSSHFIDSGCTPMPPCHIGMCLGFHDVLQSYALLWSFTSRLYYFVTGLTMRVYCCCKQSFCWKFYCRGCSMISLVEWALWCVVLFNRLDHEHLAHSHVVLFLLMCSLRLFHDHIYQMGHAVLQSHVGGADASSCNLKGCAFTEDSCMIL